MERNNPADIYQFSDSFYSSHRKIIDLVGSHKKVLDVGCNKGYLAVRFKRNGCFVVGIEKDEESAKVAKSFCDEVIQGDVEKIEELKYPLEYFDVLVFADILEHLTEPGKVLQKLKKYLKPEGCIVASLPNVARLDIRLKLLFGKFDYTESGILDKTHLRFFTLAGTKKLFKENGYRIVNIDYSGSVARLKVFTQLFAFQFIIVAKKSTP